VTENYTQESEKEKGYYSRFMYARWLKFWSKHHMQCELLFVASACTNLT